MASFYKATSSKNKSLPLLQSAKTGVLMKEGFLSKRQRGRRTTDLKGLKFQQRFCTLGFNVLKYYSKEKVSSNNLKPGCFKQLCFRTLDINPVVRIRLL